VQEGSNVLLCDFIEEKSLLSISFKKGLEELAKRKDSEYEGYEDGKLVEDKETQNMRP
jgi:hypothetical protein